MKRKSWVGLVVAATLVGASGAQSQASDVEDPVSLPEGIVWETNYDDPPIGSPDAIRGGTFNYMLGAYPLTFRLMGPNANDAFAGWNRQFTMYFRPIILHPATGNFIPWLATHWSVQDDGRTIYLKLDPDARFSDGEPITADDYVFTWKMWTSEHVIDPYYNTYGPRVYESVDKIDDYTLRVVGTRPSWRPLWDYIVDLPLWPTPAHATVLDEGWLDRVNNEPQLAIGPYVVTDVSRGESVTFERIDDWWGDGKYYFQGLFNFDRIHLRVIPPGRELDYLRRGEIDLMPEGTARIWNEEYTFDAVRNGWLRRARVFVDTPSGVNGLHMNLEAVIFQNKDFRKAIQHLFNFERLNSNLMFDSYFRQVSFFDGTEFADPDLAPYEFDPILARVYLERAGYRRPEDIRSESFIGGLWNAFKGILFTRKDTDGILVNEQGERASFSVIYGSPTFGRHLTVMQQEYRRAGVDMQLQLLEPATAFERGLERKYEMIMTGRVANQYPDPRQYLHSDFKGTTNNNAIWGFGTEEVDEFIQIYEEGLDAEARLEAMHRIDQIVQEEAFYLPFWVAPYFRIVYWDYLQFPEFYLPKKAQYPTEFMVFWIDPEKRAALEQAMETGEALPLDEEIDKDYYGIRERFLP